uniref:Uncharacterized protein n=1 Tax=uncultured marine group II/III euryarchaeote KM3_87_G11 TaxID=1456534 RepID=A0A075HWA6_9EURY|nr:hypothetical protein [uncultured marine group II/III euryarchaeote KM3_87_G11]
MTTQAITATVSGPTGGKEFSDTSTDDKWDANNLLDTIGSADLGQVMPGAPIDHVQVEYAGGACLWRIQDRNTLQVKRWGLGSFVGQGDYEGASIAPYVVQPADILTAYPTAVDATANQSNALAWIQTSKGPEGFGAQDIPDGTATALNSLVTGDNLGTFYGTTLQGFSIQLEDGASLSKVQIIGPDGGTVATWFGTTRDAAHYFSNLTVSCNIPIEKGTTMKVTCATA